MLRLFFLIRCHFFHSSSFGHEFIERVVIFLALCAKSFCRVTKIKSFGTHFACKFSTKSLTSSNDDWRVDADVKNWLNEGLEITSRRNIPDS